MLVLTVVITGVLALLSMSFSVSVQTQLETAQEGKPRLYAEMAAHSALEHAIKRFAMDPEWEGTGDEAIPLGKNLEFEVVLLEMSQSSGGAAAGGSSGGSGGSGGGGGGDASSGSGSGGSGGGGASSGSGSGGVLWEVPCIYLFIYLLHL